MNTPPRWATAELLQLALVLALAAALRIGYLHVAAADGRSMAAAAVQGQGPQPELARATELRGRKLPTEFDQIVHNFAEHRWFAALAPLAEQEEQTAHVAPGYYWLVGMLTTLDPTPDASVRWIQCGLGVLTVGCLFLFTRRAFGSCTPALVAGLLAAVHPFWIVNTAELADGVLATFLLAAALMLGTRGSQNGGAFTSLLYGLCLAGMAMVRASMLPFAVLALLWFLCQCKHVRHGWFNALLAFLGFANGLAPWAVRNWQAFHEPTPIVTSAYLHLWIGNNPNATGGPLDEAALRKSLPADRLKALLEEPNQARRYAQLGQDVWSEIERDPAAGVTHRWQASLRFFVGDAWFRDQPSRLSLYLPAHAGDEIALPPEWLTTHLELALQSGLFLLLVLGLLGWRWSLDWKQNARLATLALLWLPLPYVLSHAEELSGPRLPWDAVLICFSGYALACLIPSVARSGETE